MVCALALAGCGGGDGDATDRATDDQPAQLAEKHPTKAQYLARGDAICADAQAELIRLQARVERAQAPGVSADRRLELGAEIWRDQLAINRSFAAKFRALGAPKGDEDRVKEFLRALDEGAALAREVIQHLEDAEDPPRSLVEDYAKVAYRGNALAQSYGFRVCGRAAS